MGRKIDLINQRFGRLLVLEQGDHKGKLITWSCRCDCGNMVSVITDSLRRGNTKSCGCLHLDKVVESNTKDMSGQKINKLTIVDINKRKTGDVFWNCVCDCGVKTVVRGASIRSGATKSCGCIKRARNLIGEVFGRWKVISETNRITGTSKIWKCICECGSVGEVSYANLHSGSSRSCGCRQKEIARKTCQNRKGILHPLYNTDMTTEERELRRKIEGYSEWRESVFLRDDYTCRVCGDRGVSLESHHLDGWHWCKERRLDIENGVTLCSDCHKEFHKIYGNGNNTAEEFFEYYLVKKC